MPALVLWCLAGCPSGLPEPVPLGPRDTDIAPTDTDTDGDTDPEVVHRVPLKAEIVYPAHGDEFELGDTVYLEGEARIDGVLIHGAEFHWTSSLDGFLDDGASVPWTPMTLGDHVIELEVEIGDADDRDQIDIVVER